MKFVKITLFILSVVFVGIQFIPTKRNKSNDISLSDFMIVYSVPEQIEVKIKASCYDCHSNNTSYPWYDKIQPVSWFLENHIEEGKEELNFNTFGDYSVRRQKSKLKSIVNQIKNDEMPLSSYAFIHSGAKFLEGDKKLITEWFLRLKDSI